MPVYDPNAPAIPKPVKLTAPIMAGGEHVWEEPFNRVQIFGSMMKYLGKWRMWFMWHYRIDPSNPANKFHHIGYAEADTPAGPWKKIVVGSRDGVCSPVVMKNEDAFSCYFDTYAGKFRGMATKMRVESHNGIDWSGPAVDYPGGPISLIRHQAFASSKPFIATVRGETIVNGVAFRRVAYVDSGDWVNWSSKQYITLFDSPDSGATQPYGLMLTSYGSKILGLVPWLHLDQGSNQVGRVTAELVWTTPPAGATSLAQCTWTRTNQPFLECGEEGSFDYGMVLPTSMVIEGDTVYIPYTAQREKHGIVPAPGNMTIGLATMPKAELDAILAA